MTLTRETSKLDDLLLYSFWPARVTAAVGVVTIGTATPLGFAYGVAVGLVYAGIGALCLLVARSFQGTVRTSRAFRRLRRYELKASVREQMKTRPEGTVRLLNHLMEGVQRV